MIFTATLLPGAWLIEPERLGDERGFFARTWCAATFKAHGLIGELAQCSISFNHHRDTLRGMHYQNPPHAEVKLVRCTMGAIYDVIIDLRPHSPTFKQHFGVELSAQNRMQLYVPTGCAHGFQTLEDHSEVFYQMPTAYVPNVGRGVRWDDPAFDIAWPPAKRIILERDQHYPDFAG